MKFMNGKKAKAIRKLSDVLLLDWLNRNLPEGSENVPIQNIRDYLPKDVELIFLFANPSAPMPQAKRRKDGTKRSHAEWAEANKFRWFSRFSLPKEWIDSTAPVPINENYQEEAE